MGVRGVRTAGASAVGSSVVIRAETRERREWLQAGRQVSVNVLVVLAASPRGWRTLGPVVPLPVSSGGSPAKPSPGAVHAWRLLIFDPLTTPFMSWSGART